MERDDSWVISKFGGTSVGDPAHWPTIEGLVRARLASGERPLLVCSALSGVSNALERLILAVEEGGDTASRLDDLRERHVRMCDRLDLDFDVDSLCDHLARLVASARGLDRVPPPLRAEILAIGETLSARMCAQWLAGRGLDAEFRDARNLLPACEPPEGASQTQRHLSAACGHEPDPALDRRLREAGDGTVFVTQGFMARGRDGRTVLLGRGGSDTAAAYLAAKLGARRLEIWTDVPGVFSANPQSLPEARLLRHLSYDEAEVLAGRGAKVLHPRCIHPVREAEIPLQIRWTSRPNVEGTVVSPAVTDRANGPKAVTTRGGLCIVTMRRNDGWQPVGFLADVSECFRRHALAMDLVASAPTTIRTTLDPASCPGVRERLPALIEDLREVCEPEAEFDAESVTLVGRGVRSYLHRLGPALETLRNREPTIVSQDADDLTLTWVLSRGEGREAERALHATVLEGAPEGLFGPRWSELESAPAEKRRMALAH